MAVPHNRKLLGTIIVAFVLMAILSILLFMGERNPDIEDENAQELYADEVITLDKTGAGKDGFTCTGAVFDPLSDSFFIGDAGKIKPDEEVFHAVVRQVTKELDAHLKTYDCYSMFGDMRDIQGVTLDGIGNIWFCSYGENLIRCIDKMGNDVSSFKIKNPSGIAWSEAKNSLWILTDNHLLETTNSGEILNKYYFKIQGQDQLFYDNKSNTIFITAGIDYYGDSYIYTFDVDRELFELRYILKDSFAIEGISIVENKMYVFNDGLYHDAKIPVNQVNIYYIE